MDSDDVTTSPSVQQTQHSDAVRNEQESLLTNNNAVRNAENTHSEPSVDTKLKVGRNIIKIFALILFIITMVITSHLVRNHFNKDTGTNDKILELIQEKTVRSSVQTLCLKC